MFPFAVAHPIVHFNAGLNSFTAVLLVLAYLFIRSGKERAHKITMWAALLSSALFLCCYLYYHYLVGHVKFTYPDVSIRVTYYGILLSHLLLAMTVPYFAVRSTILGMRTQSISDNERGSDKDLELRRKHRQLARWALPIWLYVSVTGVIVYTMLYHIWPPETL